MTSWHATALLPPTDRALFAARRTVSALLLAWGYAEAVERVELVTTELVANGVRHAGHDGDLELEVWGDADTIRVSVADGSPEIPQVRDNGGHPAARGLGLRMVERLALRWGVEEYLLGKRVWAELPVRAASLEAGPEGAGPPRDAGPAGVA
jgi:anti-sigma regulatory factor (Ser/Thr protein kinase)